MNGVTKQDDEIYCPGCAKPIKKDFTICPYCRTEIKDKGDIEVQETAQDSPEENKDNNKKEWKPVSIWKILIPIVLVVAVFILFVSCVNGCFNSPVTANKTNRVTETTSYTKPVKTTIDVEYIVLGFSSIMDTVPPEVSVTYSNSQGGTEQISSTELKKTPSDLGLAKEIFGDKLRGEIIAEYKNFPISGFMYLSAQNQKDFGNIEVVIIVDNVPFKYSVAKGGYAIAEASGVFN